MKQKMYIIKIKQKKIKLKKEKLVTEKLIKTFPFFLLIAEHQDSCLLSKKKGKQKVAKEKNRTN